MWPNAVEPGVLERVRREEPGEQTRPSCRTRRVRSAAALDAERAARPPCRRRRRCRYGRRAGPGGRPRRGAGRSRRSPSCRSPRPGRARDDRRPTRDDRNRCSHRSTMRLTPVRRVRAAIDVDHRLQLGEDTRPLGRRRASRRRRSSIGRTLACGVGDEPWRIGGCADARGVVIADRPARRRSIEPIVVDAPGARRGASSASSRTASATPICGRSQTGTGARRSRCCSVTRAPGIVDAVGDGVDACRAGRSACSSRGRCPCGIVRIVRARAAAAMRPRMGCSRTALRTARGRPLPARCRSDRSRPIRSCTRRRPCPVPDGLDLDAGVPARVRRLDRHRRGGQHRAGPRPGDTVAVIGLGGIGLSALQGAQARRGGADDRDRPRGGQARDRRAARRNRRGRRDGR